MIKNEKQKIAEYFGEAVQMQQLVEEMSELTKIPARKPTV